MIGQTHSIQPVQPESPKVLAKIGTDYQTNDQLLPQSMHVVNDAGWAGTSAFFEMSGR